MNTPNSTDAEQAHLLAFWLLIGFTAGYITAYHVDTGEHITHLGLFTLYFLEGKITCRPPRPDFRAEWKAARDEVGKMVAERVKL